MTSPNPAGEPRSFLITGGSGALAIATAEALLARGASVVIATRSPEAPRLRTLAMRGAVVLPADTCQPRTLAALPPVRTLIHLVDTRDESLPRADFWDINVASVYNILEWALHAGVRHVVLGGAADAAGRVELPGELLHESDQCQPLSAYGKAKLAAERVGLQWSARHRIPLSVARLAPLFGPGIRYEPVDRAIRYVNTGQFDRPPTETFVHPLYLDDAVAGLLLLAFDTGTMPRVYFVSGGHPVSERGLCRELASAAGRESLGRALKPTALPDGERLHEGYSHHRMATEFGYRPGRWLENQLLTTCLDQRARELEAATHHSPDDPGSSGVRDLFGRVRARLLRAA